MDFIGLALAGLTMIPFLSPGGPDPTVPERTTIVRIGAGISASGNRDTVMMGSVPGIALFDVGGNKIGQTAIDDTDAKAWQDISILTDGDVQDTQPEYISLSAGKDAICIAYVIVTTSAGLKYAWVGDIAKACGVPNYYTPPQFNQQSNEYAPACMWLKGDSHLKKAKFEVYDGAPLQFRGMGIHITDFSTPADAKSVGNTIGSGQSAAYESNHDLFCKSTPRFWMYDELMPDDYIPYFVGGLRFNADGTDADPSKILDGANWATETPPPEAPPPDYLPVEEKRGLPGHDHRHSTSWVFNSTQIRQKQPYRERVVRNNVTEMNLRSSYINTNIMPGHLITSNATMHIASKLCNDPSSAGPDFVSHTEQMYCDMSIKKTFPLCVGLTQGPCFDMNTYELHLGPQGKRDTNQATKNYVKVIDW